MALNEQIFVGCESKSVTCPPLPAAAPGRSSRDVAATSWGQRRWEGAETNRLNEAHWLWARDESINTWLASQLSILRGRSVYEWKNNPVVLGMLATHSDDIVGPDGPKLQVQSDDKLYNEALERAWEDWAYAPTHLPDISFAALLRLWIKSIWKHGAYLAQIIILPDAEGPIKMRLRPMSPRRLDMPAQMAGNPNVFMGIEYDDLGRPRRYWIADQRGIGTGTNALSITSSPIPADLIVHGYIYEEEDQGRGIPLLASTLSTAADLRDFDDSTMDAARRAAEDGGLLYCTRTDIPTYTVPEETRVERRTIKMAPPGWEYKPFDSGSPPVQYPEYRAEKHLDLGRPASMPRLLVRLDASRHSWASARLDIDTFRRAASCLQAWLSGSERSTGTLNRLVDEVAKEARFVIPALRKKPGRVKYQWSWRPLPDVEPEKQQNAYDIGLRNGTITLTDTLRDRNKTLEQHLEERERETRAYDERGIPHPAWMDAPAIGGDQTTQTAAAAPRDSDQADAIEEVLNG
jgi:capsid protein